jgi:hypothetical protein
MRVEFHVMHYDTLMYTYMTVNAGEKEDIEEKNCAFFSWGKGSFHFLRKKAGGRGDKYLGFQSNHMCLRNH